MRRRSASTIALFLSTPSARRATPRRAPASCCRHDFYPRPPRGGRRGSSPAMDGPLVFLSTPSARRATLQAGDDDRALGISIHALREEGDVQPADRQVGLVEFLSTPSARRATAFPPFCRSGETFLSTPSARRATQWLQHILARHLYFYPRPPRGGRPKAPTSP